MEQVDEERNTNSTLTLEDLDSFGNLNLQTGFDFDKEISMRNIQEIDQLYHGDQEHDFGLEIDQMDELEDQDDLGEDLDQLDLDQLDLHYENQYDNEYGSQHDNQYEEKYGNDGLDHLRLDQIQDPLNQSEIDQLEGMTRLTMPIEQGPTGRDENFEFNEYQRNADPFQQNKAVADERNGGKYEGRINYDGPFSNSVNVNNSRNHSSIGSPGYRHSLHGNPEELVNTQDYNHSPRLAQEENFHKNNDEIKNGHISSLLEQISTLKTQLLHSERDKQVQLLQLRKDLLGEKERVLLDFTNQVQERQRGLEGELKICKEDILRLEGESAFGERRITELQNEKNQGLAEIEALRKHISDLKASNESLLDKLDAQREEVQSMDPISNGFPLDELKDLIEPVITIPSPISADALRQGIKMLTDHVQSQSDRLKHYKVLDSDWKAEKIELEKEYALHLN